MHATGNGEGFADMSGERDESASEPDGGVTGEDDHGPAHDVEPAHAPVEEAQAPAQEAFAVAEPPRGGVTVPVAVPVTVALVLGLAIGLILGWVIPRPGGSDTASAGTEAGSPGDDGAATRGSDDGAAAQPDEPTGSDPANALVPPGPLPVDGGPEGTEDYAGLVIGGGDQLVEVFEDYVCPFCARLELSSGAQLREAALDGEFTLVLHPIAFLTEDSPRAANASSCVYQHEEDDTWVAFHEVVYERQDPSEAVGQYTNEILLGMADEVGATSEETAACIQDGDYLGWVSAITQQSFERGVRGTPTVTVDGTLTDVAPLIQ